jgi:aspartyl-tRNA(Asn)/glutamyl-tRNA(Gln) amidotransferase subunit C
MKLTREDVLKLAKLSRLKLSEDEIVKFQTELSAILGYVNQLDSVDVEGVRPTYQVTGLTSVFREDEVNKQVEQEKLMKNVPDTEKSLIKVKRMIG